MDYAFVHNGTASGESIRCTRVPVDRVLDLAAMLPAAVGLRIEADQKDEPAVGHGAGYFGLAVALARKTWQGED